MKIGVLVGGKKEGGRSGETDAASDADLGINWGISQ